MSSQTSPFIDFVRAKSRGRQRDLRRRQALRAGFRTGAGPSQRAFQLRRNGRLRDSGGTGIFAAVQCRQKMSSPPLIFSHASRFLARGKTGKRFSTPAEFGIKVPQGRRLRLLFLQKDLNSMQTSQRCSSAVREKPRQGGLSAMSWDKFLSYFALAVFVYFVYQRFLKKQGKRDEENH